MIDQTAYTAEETSNMLKAFQDVSEAYVALKHKLVRNIESEGSRARFLKANSRYEWVVPESLRKDFSYFLKNLDSILEEHR